MSDQQAINNVNAGNWSLTVTDEAGNTAEATFIVEQPQILSSSIVQTQPAQTNQDNGVASASVNGGTPPYTIAWDNGESAQEAVSLAPGTHSITISDANGCIIIDSVNITENILPLSVRLNTEQAILCAGEENAEIKAVVVGGKSPFKYTWSPEVSTDETAKMIKEGSYKVVVVDMVGQSASAEIEITSPDSLYLSIIDSRPATSESSRDGKASILITGGTPPYTFEWSNGESTQDAENLPIGMQKVSVTDANNCNIEATIEIKKRILPELSASQLQEGQTIRMQTLQFEADSFRVNEESVPVIREVAQFLKDNANIVVEIGGHTNNIPEHSFCDWLSTERAKAVAEYIVQKMQIDGKRVYYQGYGKRNPIATNQTEEGRRLNQRVEVKILSIKGVLDD